jgi:surfeit locus 1 family protein
VSARGAAWALLALLAAAGFAALGAWQWQRAAQKDAMLARWRTAGAAPAQALAAALDRPELVPVRVAGDGRFVPGATVLLDNQIRAGRVGVMVLSLFQPEGAHRAVLVNRGWIALDARRQIEEAPAEVAGRVALSGLLRRPPSAGLQVENAAWQAGAPPPMLNWLDLPVLARQFGHELFPGVLLLDPGMPFGYARDWEPLPNTLPPERHRGYAVQWFGLALAVLVTFGILWKKRNA